MVQPDGTRTPWPFPGPDVEEDEPGTLLARWPITQAGIHHWGFTAEGVVNVGQETVFNVRQPVALAPPA